MRAIHLTCSANHLLARIFPPFLAGIVFSCQHVLQLFRILFLFLKFLKLFAVNLSDFDLILYYFYDFLYLSDSL